MSDDAQRDEAICREARADLIRDAIRWTIWCARQGIRAAKDKGVWSPDDILMDYIEKTGDEDQIQLPDRLAEQARLNGMGSEREAIIRLLQNGIDINDASMRLHMGEATAQELRTARAWLGYMLAQVKATGPAIRSLTAPDKEGAP